MNSEGNEINRFVCLTDGRERAFYLRNSEGRLINNEDFYTSAYVDFVIFQSV